MRKAAAALTVAGTVFAVTAAAASAVSVSGPFNPSTATGAARLCTTGAITLSPDITDTSVTGYELTTASDSSTDTDCDTASIWVKVTYTPSGGTATSIYTHVTADADYTGGVLLPLNAADGVFVTSLGGSTKAASLAAELVTTTSTSVLVTVGTPTSF